MRFIRILLAAAVAAAALTTLSIGSAEAEESNNWWKWRTSTSHGNLAFASYDKDSGTLRVDDREKDGHSVYLHVDGPGWNNTNYWDKNGAEGTGSYFDLLDNYDRGDTVSVKFCTGEWDDKSTIKCSDWKGGFRV